MSAGQPPNRRVLLVDDNLAIYDDFRRILEPHDSGNALDSAAAALFGAEAEPAKPGGAPFELEYAQQGAEACEKAAAAVAAGRPFAVAFVDMRMPPGWDGLTTIRKLWEIDPDLQAVICTAYSDRSWSEIQAELTARDRWLVLKKPFDKVEVLQLGQALTEKWNLARLSRQQLATMEEQVQLRTRELRRAIQVKNEFLANVTHELLTPLNGVLGMLHLLADAPLGSEQAACVSDARASADRLHQLLSQILTYNQAEAGTLMLEAETFSAAVLLEEVVDDFRTRAASRGIALRTTTAASVPPAVHAPRVVIRQVLTALVENAVKFSSNGTVTLGVAGDAFRLAFSVGDTGAGLTTEQLGWIEQPFAQVDAGLKRRHAGIGLGLPFAKRLAASLGGELRIESAPGAGTTVTFTALAAPGGSVPRAVG